jgi:hypothetical protein
MAKRLDRSDSKSKSSVRFKRTAAPSKYSNFDSRGKEAVSDPCRQLCLRRSSADSSPTPAFLSCRSESAESIYALRDRPRRGRTMGKIYIMETRGQNEFDSSMRAAAGGGGVGRTACGVRICAETRVVRVQCEAGLVISMAQTAAGRIYMEARKFPLSSQASGVRNQ